MPVEHPREDQVRQRDGVLGGLADGVGEVEPVEALVEAAAERVQEDDGAQLGGARPERLEPRVGEFDVAGEGRDLDTGEPAAEHGVVEALDDALGMLQRHEPETGEPVGRLGDVLPRPGGSPRSRPRPRGPRAPTGRSGSARR